MMKKFFLRLALVQAVVLSMTPAYGQKVLEDIRDDVYRAGGVYYHYVYDAPCGTPAPEGYEPFYISHYGRHGSRWLSRETDYSAVREMFAEADSAGILTPFGKDVYSRVEEICDDAAGRAGALTPLGTRQHKEIAGRMAEAFPQVFEGAARINASSTTYPRCILSMAAFCERLKEKNPVLQIERASDLRTTRILNFFHNEANPEICDDFRRFSRRGKWLAEYRGMAPEYILTDRLTACLFTDSGFFAPSRTSDFVHGLYRLAVNRRDTLVKNLYLGQKFQCGQSTAVLPLFDIGQSIFFLVGKSFHHACSYDNLFQIHGAFLQVDYSQIGCPVQFQILIMVRVAQKRDFKTIITGLQSFYGKLTFIVCGSSFVIKGICLGSDYH